MRALIVVVVVTLLSWAADAGTKLWALNHDHAQLVPIIPGLFVALVPPLMNTGAGALVMGMGLPQQFADFARHGTIVFPIVLVLGSIAWMYRIEQQETAKLTLAEQIGFGLLIGGTFSNLYDRLFRHAVIDFINFAYLNLLWNIADVTIVLGLFLVGVQALRLHRLIKPKPAPEATAG